MKERISAFTKTIVLVLFIVVFSKNIFAIAPPAISGAETALTQDLIFMGGSVENPNLDVNKFVDNYLNVDGKNYGTLILKDNFRDTDSSCTKVNGQITQQSICQLPVKFQVVNNSDSIMHASFIIPYAYMWGYNNYPLSFNGQPYSFDNTTNQFIFSGIDASGVEQTSRISYSSDPDTVITYPTRSEDSNLSKYVLTDPFSSVSTTPDLSQIPFKVKSLASFSTSDKYIKVDLGMLNPGESKDVNMEVSFNPLKYRNTAAAYTGFNQYALLYYKLDSSVKINYLDTNNNVLSDSKVNDGYIGDEYTTEPLTIAGYHLVSTPSNSQGIYNDTQQQINYIYEKNESSEDVKDTPKTNSGEDVKDTNKTKNTSNPSIPKVIPKTGSEHLVFFTIFVGLLAITGFMYYKGSESK